MTYFGQGGAAVRCEWGLQGLLALAPECDALVIVDVLSFCTSVDVAVSRGVWVYPYGADDEGAERYAESVGALLARRRSAGGYSLSPASLLGIPAGARIVLPSPNGSALSRAVGETPALAGCLRNAAAVAAAAARLGACVGVVAAGERWPDGSLRPALEDWLGAGAICARLPGPRSPEAEGAAAAFEQARPALARLLAGCGSGRELIGRGFGEDVRLAAALDVSEAAPLLQGGAYRPASA